MRFWQSIFCVVTVIISGDVFASEPVGNAQKTTSVLTKSANHDLTQTDSDASTQDGLPLMKTTTKFFPLTRMQMSRVTPGGIYTATPVAILSHKMISEVYQPRAENSALREIKNAELIPARVKEDASEMTSEQAKQILSIFGGAY